MTDTATADLLEPDLLQPVPYGYCHCRCGGRTSIAKGTDSRRGWIKGQPVRFILGHSRIDRRDCSERFWEQVDKNGPIVRPELGPCWLWIGYRDQDGYGVSRVNGRRRATHVALELAGYFILFKGLEALHRCDNCQCIRPDHLKIDTKPANIADKVAKGRQARGEHIAEAKLDPEKAREVRALYQRGVLGRGYEALARRFGVSQSTIWRIIQDETWKHVA
ncbi:MAG TPA: hypothetical protein VN961_21530 [Streptosporangiaceae bacterium]|nr:hypothetical protein [Streptosporangiaceae bacterium]